MILSSYAPTPAMMEHATQVIRNHLTPSPLLRYHLAGVDVPVYLKLESLQPSGSFKVRGALSAVSAYAGEGHPVVTASAGNHGLGVAYAAQALSVEAAVVLPETASPAKIEALRRFPVDLRLVGTNFEAAEEAAMELASAGYKYVSAYNDAWVSAGQGTIVGELTDELDSPFTLVLPVGGGGLAAGCGVAASLAGRDIRVIGVEAEASRAVSSAVSAGKVLQIPIDDTIADGLAGNIEDNCITPSIIAESGVELSCASEAAIHRAVRELAMTAGIVAEGSSAVTLALVRAGGVPMDRPIVLTITGRNIAGPLFAKIVNESS